MATFDEPLSFVFGRISVVFVCWLFGLSAVSVDRWSFGIWSLVLFVCVLSAGFFKFFLDVQDFTSLSCFMI